MLKGALMNCLPREAAAPPLRETMCSAPKTEQDGHLGSGSTLPLNSWEERKPLLPLSRACCWFSLGCSFGCSAFACSSAPAGCVTASYTERLLPSDRMV